MNIPGAIEVRQIGDALMILGDCREVLSSLEGVADLLVCDVAYKLIAGGCAHQSMGGIFAKDNYDNKGNLMQVPKWHELGGPFLRACKANADAYIMTNDKNIFQAGMAFEGAGWQFHNMLAWNKVRATRNKWYMKNLEFTQYWFKGKSSPKINDCGSMQLFTLNAKKETSHPTEKPVALMDHYIRNSSNQGDTVLDPMAGSGATIVAAVKAGRRAIGIEIEPKYFEMACARVAQAVAGQEISLC